MIGQFDSGMLRRARLLGSRSLDIAAPSALAHSLDGARVVPGSGDERVRIWNVGDLVV